jgi:hypothetical protein
LPFGNNHLMAAGQNDDRIFEIGSPVKQGINWAPANAFEVSYNGHSIVYHTNGQSLGGSPKVYQGATYVESPVYAWGAIDALGNVIGTSSFGISASVQIMAPGVYMISLAPADPHSGPTPSLADASVTVTVLNNDITDITVAPPEPPGGGLTAPTAAAAPRTVSDSLVRTRFGDAAESAPTLSASSSALSPLLPNICGYATASQIGVLAGTYGSAYANSFIVRTYTYGEQCQRANLPFFFKVCHR